MASPFIYTKEVVGDLFVGRREELAWLSSNMLNGQDSILIASPRYGKTSLVRQALLQAQKQDFNIKFCYINLFNVRKEIDFYKKLANQALQAVCETTDDWEVLVRNFFPRCNPRVEINSKANEVKVLFDTERLLLHSDECLSFFQRYAESVDKRIIVCLEEFQNIERFDDEIKFQKRLSKQLKHHNMVSYVFTGGKKNAMRGLFENPKKPLHKFGDVFILPPIEDKLFTEYIVRSFSKSGRVITKEQAEKLCNIVKNHPYFAQLLANLMWENTKGFVTGQTMDSSERELLEFCHAEYNHRVDELSIHQISYMKAIIDGVDRFCSIESITLYDLHSSANVARVRSALAKKEILEFARSKPYFIDPVFEIWFKNIYMQ